ncbi:hypothetical protein KY346_04315 [Candidatus Woesearchaeota archaeon]|nr:hypothetical protein [Candidatus Woesearchaeota archaeon]
MKKALQLAALFMALLVLALPVAIAQKLDVDQFSGKDKVEGIVRPADDALYIIVTAEMRGNPTPELARKRLKLVHGGDEEFFSSCTSLSSSMYQCLYNSTDIINSGAEEYRIILLDAENNELKSVKKVLVVDRMPPQIIQFSVQPEMSRTGDMNIKYFIEDYGKKSGDTAICAGLKEISITADSTTLKKVDFDQPNVCDSGEQEFDYSYSTEDKFVGLDVCLVARDYLGQESDVTCESFSIDNSPPRIKSVEFRDKDGYEFSHIKTGQKVVADMFVTIDNEDDVVLDSVKADLSNINPGAGVKKADEGSENIFVWRNVAITSPSTCEVDVSAVDEIGNEASTTLTCTLPVDDTGPVPQNIYASAASSNATPLIGVNGTIYVDFLEEGSGMDKGRAFLDLHNLGLGTVVQADKCSDQGNNIWTCEWTVAPKVSTGNYKITSITGTNDDLGNYAGAMSTNVDFDMTPPEINSVDVTFIHENADYGPYAVYGDTIEFFFNITDAVEGYANLSMIGGGYAPAIECTEKHCKFSSLIDVSGPLNATIHFDFFDIARNHEAYDYDFYVYGVMINDTETNYWKSKVTCSPTLIDRHTAELYNHPVYCRVKLTPNNPDVEPVFVKPGDLDLCTGDFAGYVVDVEAINNNLGSKDPYLVFTLAAAPFEINELKFTCPVFVASRVGDFFSPGVEIENATVKLEFYDLPYGEAYSNMEDEIKSAMKSAMRDWEWVGTVEDIMDMARKICNVKTTFTSSLAALEAVLDLLVVAGAIVGIGSKDAGQALISAAQTLCKTEASLDSIFSGKPKAKSGEKITKKETKKKTLNLFNIADLLCKMANCQLSREEAEKYEDDIVVKASWIFGAGNEEVCKFYKDLAGGALLLDTNKLMKDSETGAAMSPVDIKESIVGSVACTCLPGITYNLNKMRQIYCGYAYCLGKHVLEEGLPKSYCMNEKAYLTCNYVVGQIFEFAPFTALVEKYNRIIQDVYANPISAITVLSSLVCGGSGGAGGFYDYCYPRGSLEEDTANMGLYLLCTLSLTTAKVGDAIASIMLVEDEWTKDVSENYCDKAEEMLE